MEQVECVGKGGESAQKTKKCSQKVEIATKSGNDRMAGIKVQISSEDLGICDSEVSLIR